MRVNADKPHLWKADVARSVDFYNDWFLEFAPKAYRDTRKKTTAQVEQALVQTRDLRDISPAILRTDPKTVLPMLRMSTAPPIARDRLIGLAGVVPSLVYTMEKEGKLPSRMLPEDVDKQLRIIGAMIRRLADKDIFTWLDTKREGPTHEERYRAATIVADRLCGAVADPIIRNTQEQRQLAEIKKWLEARGYKYLANGQGIKAREMKAGTFCFRLNVPIALQTQTLINVPVDAAIMPLTTKPNRLPLFVEAKSAGDFTNTNKRRKEEATKINQLRSTYGEGVRYVLFLCGYFDSGYLGYEASEGIDWVWEHRIDDLAQFGL